MPTAALTNMLRDMPAAVLAEVAAVERDRDAQLDTAAQTLVALRKQIDALKAGGGGIQRWLPGAVITPGSRWVLPEAQTGTSIIIDKPGVEFFGTAAQMFPFGGPFFNVRAGGDDFTATAVLFDAPNPAKDAQGKYSLPDCITTVAKRTTARRCIVRKVNTFLKAMIGADGTLADGCDAEGFTAYFLYAGGAGNSEVRLSRVDGGVSIETPVRATKQDDPNKVPVFPVGIAVRYSDVTSDPRKAGLDLREVYNATVEHCDIRQLNGAMAVRLGDSTAPGCQDFVFRKNRIYRGFVHAKAKASGFYDGNETFGLDPLTQSPVSFDAAAQLVTRVVNVAYTVGSVPANAKRLPTGNVWAPQP